MNIESIRKAWAEAASTADRIFHPVMLAVMIVIAVAGLAATWKWQPHVLRSDVERLEARLEAVESRVIGMEKVARLDSRVLQALRMRVESPRFCRHRDGCPQCRGDIPSEEGGPAPLCEEGFEAMKQDRKELNGQQ